MEGFPPPLAPPRAPSPPPPPPAPPPPPGQPAPGGEDDADAQRAQDLHQGEEEGIVADRPEQQVPVPGVDLLEPVEGAEFLAEGLNRRHPGDVLLQVGIQSGQNLPALPVVLPSPAPVGRRQEEEGGGNQGGG